MHGDHSGARPLERTIDMDCQLRPNAQPGPTQDPTEDVDHETGIPFQIQCVCIQSIFAIIALCAPAQTRNFKTFRF